MDKILNTRGLAMSAPLPRQNRGYGVFKRKSAPDAIRGGDRSRQENASDQESGAPFRFDRNEKGSRVGPARAFRPILRPVLNWPLSPVHTARRVRLGESPWHPRRISGARSPLWSRRSSTARSSRQPFPPWAAGKSPAA